MIDVNVSIGHYPFRQFPFDSQDPAVLKARLQRCGIERACASSLHAVFYADPQQGNAELLPRLVDDPFYLPVGVVNPSLQNWAETLERCVDDYGCRLVKIYPSYHTYALTDRSVEAFLAAAQERGIRVAIVQRVEDERMHHLLMKVPPPATVDIAGTAQRYGHPLLVLSAYHAEIRQLAKSAENLYFDIAMAETMNTLHSLTADVAPQRLLLGTHTPFFYPEAALGKLTTWETEDANRQCVARENAAELLGLDG